MRTSAVLAAVLLAAPIGAAEKSGGDKGFSVPAFDVLDVTGPNAAKKLCYV